MSLFKHLRIFTTVAIALSTLNAYALNEQIKKLIYWETKANGATVRSADPVKIEHYEIPMSVLSQDMARNVPAALEKALIFEKNGRQYLRWSINPEDTKWHKEVEAWLKKKGLSTERHQYFTAYQTSSRSYIFEDPTSGFTFSAKVSTDKTGGNWTDKKMPLADSKDIRMTSDMVDAVRKNIRFEKSDYLPEPLMFGIQDLDQGFMIRSLEKAAEGTRYYMPAFSALHEENGKAIAKLNGSNDPVEYWTEHLAKPLGYAMAEFSAHFGMTYDSPHGQNFLVEFDKNLKPTGKIVLKDFADAYILKEFLESAGQHELLKSFEQDNIHSNNLQVYIGMLHGNKPPSWIGTTAYNDMNTAFFEAFEEHFSEISGVPVALKSKSKRFEFQLFRQKLFNNKSCLGKLY